MVVSAMTHGSMTPKQIEWDIPLSLGRQLETLWSISNGSICKRVMRTPERKEDLLG